MATKVKTQFTLTKEYIDQVFADAERLGFYSGDIMITFYRFAFPQWDHIAKISSWPKVGPAANKHLWEKFIALDKATNPTVFPGGAWLNSGFSNDDTLDDWALDTSSCRLDYIEA